MFDTENMNLPGFKKEPVVPLQREKFLRKVFIFFFTSLRLNSIYKLTGCAG